MALAQERALKYQVADDGDYTSTHAHEVKLDVSADWLAAQDEWDAVATVTATTADLQANQHSSTLHSEDADPHTNSVSSAQVSCIEVIDHFRRHEQLSLHKKDIRPCIEYSGFRACINFLFGPPNLKTALIDDRDLILAMAAWRFEDDNAIHIQMLQTIYKSLTGSRIDPPRYGNHWDDIGFQGTDPATDLRGGGCLGLVNMLYLTTNPRYTSISRSIYSLSRHQVQNFPFAVMSLNVTRMALQALRGQLLNKTANKCQDMIGTFNDFYVSCYLHLYTRWRDGNKTIQDSGYVLKDTETYCSKNVASVLKRLETHLQDKTDTVEPVATFTNIDKLDKHSLI